VVRRVNADLLAASGFAALALVFLVGGRSLSLTAQGVPGPGLFPVLIASVLLLLSVLLAVRALVLRRGAERSRSSAPSPTEVTPTALADGTGIAQHEVGYAGPSEGAASGGTTTVTEPAADEGSRSRVRPLLLWGLVLGSCLVLPVLGFVPAMLTLTLTLVLAIERRHDVVALATAVVIPVAAYTLFAVLLDVRLPLGPFG